MKKRLPLLVFLFLILSVGAEVVAQWPAFSRRYDPVYWEKRYQESNWSQGWASDNPLGDAELYAYAGWRQIQGGDPTMVNPENPPLGKYFLGLSTLIFHNPNWASLFFGCLLLGVTYLISSLIFSSSVFRFLPVALLSIDGLFRENLSVSMLDLPFAFFIALSFYCLMKGEKQRVYYLGVAAALAAVAATKMYLVGFGLTGVIALYLLARGLFGHEKNYWRWLVAAFPVYLIIYFGAYFFYFLHQHSLADFKYYHFWVRYFAKVQVTNYPQFEIWRLVFLGQWKTWWGGSGLVPVTGWNFFWPLGVSASLLGLIDSWRKKNIHLFLLSIWTTSLLLMYSFGVPYPRYLLPILPAVYLLSSYLLWQVVRLKNAKI